VISIGTRTTSYKYFICVGLTFSPVVINSMSSVVFLQSISSFALEE